MPNRILQETEERFISADLELSQLASDLESISQDFDDIDLKGFSMLTLKVLKKTSELLEKQFCRNLTIY